MPVVFKNPPINEVVIATYFSQPMAAFRSEHVGLFWERIRDAFPSVRQQPPIVSPMGIVPDTNTGEFLPMPRYWFVAEDDIYIIQVQKNAFIFNWRRRKSNEYTRFHKDIKPAFDKYYSLFDEFVRTEVAIPTLSIELCELTYINSIKQCEFWSGPQDTMNVIPSFSILSLGAEAAGRLNFNCQYETSIEADLALNIGIRSGATTQSPDKPVLIFEIKASGRLVQATKSLADDWFEHAHDTIASCFMNMTSQDIRNRYWQPVKESE